MSKLGTITLCVVLCATVTNPPTPAAPQGAQAKRAETQPEKSPDAEELKPPPPFTQKADYIVEPPDLIEVEMEQALPGRPISGSRLVRPDGKITLGFYGEVSAAGLTVPEIKIEIIDRLRRFIRDDFLGLVVLDDAGNPVLDRATGKPKRIAPKDSETVRVKLTQCNSKYFYIAGEVPVPGRYPVTGTEGILDAIKLAGGWNAAADLERIVLCRVNRQGTPAKITVDLDQIERGKHALANYLLKSGDRLFVGRVAEDRAQKRAPEPTRSQARSVLDRAGNAPPIERAEQDALATDDPSLRHLEKRMDALDHKLDLILKAISSPGRD